VVNVRVEHVEVIAVTHHERETLAELLHAHSLRDLRHRQRRRPSSDAGVTGPAANKCCDDGNDRHNDEHEYRREHCVALVRRTVRRTTMRDLIQRDRRCATVDEASYTGREIARRDSDTSNAVRNFARPRSKWFCTVVTARAHVSATSRSCHP
jgi:hypothetical protein